MTWARCNECWDKEPDEYCLECSRWNMKFQMIEAMAEFHKDVSEPPLKLSTVIWIVIATTIIGTLCFHPELIMWMFI